MPHHIAALVFFVSRILRQTTRTATANENDALRKPAVLEWRWCGFLGPDSTTPSSSADISSRIPTPPLDCPWTRRMMTTMMMKTKTKTKTKTKQKGQRKCGRVRRTEPDDGSANLLAPLLPPPKTSPIMMTMKKMRTIMRRRRRQAPTSNDRSSESERAKDACWGQRKKKRRRQTRCRER